MSKHGYEMGLYYASSALEAAPTTTGWTECTTVKDVTVNDEFEEVDETTRDDAGRKSTAPGLRDVSIEFEIEWDTSNTGFNKFFNAYKGRTTVAAAALDNAPASSGHGPAGNFKVLSFTRNEPVGGHVTANVTLKGYSYLGDL